MKRSYIVYKVTNRFNGKIYIGCHSTLNTNDRYMGSGTEIKEALKRFGRKSFIKETLATFDNKKEMLAKEKELVTKDFCMRTDTYNRIEGGGTYLNLGMIPVKDKNNKHSLIYKDDPRYLSGELVHNTTGNSFTKGKLTVKDEFGNTFHVFITDERYLSGELIPIARGQKINNGWKGRKHKEQTKKIIGKINSLIQSGNGNSQFGTCWITKEEENKKIKKEDFDVYLQQGWIKGRTNKKIN